MALRLQTTAVAAEGSAFTPTAEVILQAKLEGKGDPTVTVIARVHNDAPWRTVVSFRPSNEPFKRVAKFPQMKIGVENNTAGATVSVWDDA